MGQPSKPRTQKIAPTRTPGPATRKKGKAVKNAGTRASSSAEARQLLPIRILEKLNRPGPIKQLTHDILEMIKAHTGVQGISLRIREGEDFPFVEIIGLPAAYPKDEGALCVRGPAGEVLRDGAGLPVLECLCGAVLQGRIDPTLPVFTTDGSFWTNDLPHFMASTPEAHRPARMRDRCYSEGYRSMALIPLRSGGDVAGLLQLNDKRPNRFNPDIIRFLESIGSSIAITLAQKKSLEALTTSQALLRAIISGTSDAVYVKDISGRYLFFNDAAAQIIGKAGVDAGGLEESLLFPSDQESPAFDRDIAVIQDGRAVSVEESIATRSGKTRTYLSTKGPLFDDRGRANGMFTIAHDITERKEMEEALKASHARYLGLFENASLGIFHSLPEGRFLRANSAMASMLGYDSPEDLITNITDIRRQLYLHPEKHPVVLRSVLDNTGWVYAENEYRRKDGTAIIGKLTARRVLNADGSLAYIEGYIEDISERRRAEDALRASEEQYRELADSITDVFFEMDGDLRYTYWNKASERLLGIPARGALGKSLLEIFPDTPDIRKAEQAYRQVLATQRPLTFQSETSVGGQPTFFEDTAYPSKRGLSVFVKDITERRRVEEALQASRERYRQLVEHSKIGIGISLKNEIVFANPALLSIFGYDRLEDFARTPLLDHVAPSSRKLIAQLLENRERGDVTPAEFEFDILRKDGQIKTLIGTTSIFREGDKAYTQATFQDITGRKRAAERLQKTEQDYRMLAENSPDLIARFDTRLRHSYVNPAAAAAGHLSSDEYIGKTIAESGVPESVARIWDQRIRRVLKTGKRVDVMDAFPTPEGNRYFDTRLVPELNPDGSVGSVLSIARDITERKRAEEALRDSEERFKVLFDDAVLGLYRTTPDGKILMANPALCRMLGYASFEKLEKRNLEEDGFHPGYPRERFKKEIEEKGVIVGLEASWQLHDGGRIYVSESARAIKDAAGRVLYYEGSVEDITERHRAMEALRESEEKFKSLSEQSPNMIFINRRGLIVYANDVCSKTMGYSRQEYYAPDFDFRRLFIPESEKVVRTSFESHLAGREVPPYEIRLLTKFGREIDAVLTTKLIDFENEKAILGILTDITEQKRIQEALRHGEERFRQLVENMSSGVAVYEARIDGRDFIIKDFNRAAERIEGVARRDIVGRSVLEVFPGVVDLGLFDVFRRVWRTGEPEQLPAGIYRDDRVVGWRENYIYRLPSGEVVAIYDDVTERRNAENEIRSLNIELEERVRRRTASLEAANRELEAFAYSVSHDLRAPLRTIDGFALALEDELRGRVDDETLHYLDRIRVASQDMARLIADLLKLSRVTRAEMTYARVDLSGIVEKLAAELRAANPDRRVEWVIAPGVKADGDPQLLESALRNLLENAYKFTAKHPSARIEFGVQDDGGRQVCFVRDDGAGFDIAYADKLFNVFQRLHKAEDFEGTGVGLAIVQRIILRHGGRTWAEGAVEKGATFYFSLAEDDSTAREGGQDGSP
jgi:PAS domain S-box-containing protein